MTEHGEIQTFLQWLEQKDLFIIKYSDTGRGSTVEEEYTPEEVLAMFEDDA